MHFKGEYWIMENMHLSQNQIYRIPNAIRNCQTNFTPVPLVSINCSTYFSMSPLVSAVVRPISAPFHGCSTGGPRKINYGKSMKKCLWKKWLLYEKRLKSHPANVEPSWGNASYRKNGDRYHLSKLDRFFVHNSVGSYKQTMNGIATWDDRGKKSIISGCSSG